jgi:hypothetical protein
LSLQSRLIQGVALVARDAAGFVRLQRMSNMARLLSLWPGFVQGLVPLTRTREDVGYSSAERDCHRVTWTKACLRLQGMPARKPSACVVEATFSVPSCLDRTVPQSLLQNHVLDNCVTS